jgi:DNA repair and recombination RAD54-like protein
MGARESEDEADSSSSEEEPSASESEPSAASDSDGESQGKSEEEEENAAQSSDGEVMEEEAAGRCAAAGIDADGTAAAPDAAADDGLEPTQQQLDERRQQNIDALVSGAGLALQRQALLPRLLTVQQAAVVLRRAFKSPHPDAPAVSEVRPRVLFV